ncbi:hypothetical protein DPM19_05840 [Actinomadura craniellae]|uniref:VWFA domain-containing protein n=2 Tax=Actinomadura craniellae TaxID=2231787 RepID=A0A365HCD1_9ACTN|nr:hypothetical protein DPM19_05840 [Actinomadura craniellae]
MRRRVAELGARRPAAVIGAFHAPALAGPPPGPPVEVPEPVGEVATALIPYTFELLDSRSGYPAGIRDPEWQQDVLDARGAPAAVERAAAARLARICAELRADGHVAGTPDAAAAYRVARDLAVLRGLPAPGRRELVEALETALGQGEPLGRSRAVARAAQRVLVGDRRGTPPPGAPRSGLAVHVEELLAELGLPGPDAPSRPVEQRLDPARSPLDLRRHLALRRLRTAGVEYGAERELAGVGAVRATGRAWTVHWRPLTAATLELATAYGATLEQAAEGALEARARTLAARDELTPAARLALLEEAAEAGLARPAHRFMAELRTGFLPVAGLPELIAAHDLIERITAGHLPGLPGPGAVEAGPQTAELAAAAIGAVAGIAGSDDPADTRALLQLVQLVERGATGANRLVWLLRGLVADGAPLPQGAAAAALVLLGAEPAGTLATRLAGWADASDGAGSARRLAGALTVAGPLLESAPDLLDPLASVVEDRPDAEFLRRLPALREGFDALAPAARGRFLVAVRERHRLDPGAPDPFELDTDPAVLAAQAAADLAGRAAVRALDPALLPAGPLPPAASPAGASGSGPAAERQPAEPPATGASGPVPVPVRPPGPRPVEPPEPGTSGPTPATGRPAEPPEPGVPGSRALSAAVGRQTAGRVLGAAQPPADRPGGTPASGGHEGGGTLARGGPPGAGPAPGPGEGRAISGPDRWRLVLGRERERLTGRAARVARGLDELYGHGQGEGSTAGTGGGTGDPYPTAREWSGELEALFGARIRDEVLGRAAARGRSDAILQLDPERVTASVDLLEHVLSLAGALPEAGLARLRRLVDRLVAELTRELARRLRPALTGLATPRPSRRPVGPLDLGRTVRANLHTARRTGTAITLVPERPVFRTRARRSADWHIFLAVDVSGSMERSTIYSALTAAVLHGVPALSVHFVTFSTKVIDLTGRVADPLALLLEISVGGGTDIGRGLAYVREQITVPARSIVAVVSDFEEGVSTGRLLGEVRALAESGAHLLGLAALDDGGQPVFNRGIAERVAAAGMPVAALSPAELAAWIGERVRG